MAFEHLTKLYANYYLAKKKVLKSKEPSEEDLAAYKSAEAEYFQQLHDFEAYLDIVGEDPNNDPVGSLVRLKEDESKMGVIRKKVDLGWEIEWYSIENLKTLGASTVADFSNLEFIESA